MNKKNVILGFSIALQFVGCFEAASFPYIRLAVPPTPAGNNANAHLEPFDTDQSARLQQVFSASAFDPLVTTAGGWIGSVGFRVDPLLGHPFSTFITNVEIHLSTTSAGPDGLSAVFDNNLGTDDTLVFGPRGMRADSNGGSGFSYFDVYIQLSQPFFYNPASGNLLLDLRIHTGLGVRPTGPVIVLDAFDTPGDSVSSVISFSSTLPSVGQVSSLGLATEFIITPVPEPSTWALLLLGIGGFACVVWRNRRQPSAPADRAGQKGFRTPS